MAHVYPPGWLDRVFRGAALARVLLPNADDNPQAIRLGSYFIAAATSVITLALLFGSFLQGTLPGDAFGQVTAGVIAANIAFYAAFRTGLNRRAADPSLTMPQMAVATVLLFYALYSSGSDGAGMYPILFLMVLLFGVLRLRTRALLGFAAFILAGDAAVTVLRHYFHTDAASTGTELLQWLTLAVMLPWFALMGGYLRGLREQLGKSNAKQRIALQEVHASEFRLAQAQRIAGLGTWTFDLAARTVHWSPETYRIFGIEPSQPAPVGDAFLRLVHPEDRAHYRELLRPARDEGRPFDSEYRILWPSGEIRWLHVLGEPQVDHQGHTAVVRGTVMDITTRKAQDQALIQARDEAAAARAALMDAIESLPEAFALFDSDDRLKLCNRHYAKHITDTGHFDDIAGWSFEDIVRTSLARGEVIPPEFADDAEAWIADRIWNHRHPGPAPRELEMAHGRWVEVTERRTTSGGIVGVRSDMTERKQLAQRQAMEHAVTRLMGESESVAETMPKVIRTICETLGWDCGAHWHMDKHDRMLHCLETWSIPLAEVREFMAFSGGQAFAHSTSGLICRVLATGRPVWIADVSRQPGFKRSEAALKAGLRGAFAFPLRSGSDQVGVMEFYIRNERAPDPALLRVLDSIGLQIGQFIARRAAEVQIERLAHYDSLTGLPNRNLFNELLAHAFAKAERNAARLAILFVDLDGFKQVNDSYGHDAGDHLLATFTQRLRGCLRKSDTFGRHGGSGTAARLGGDEFVVLVNDVNDPSELAVVAQRILAVAAEPYDLAGPIGHVTASIGISVYPEDGKDVERLIKSADSAMYEAKEAGKNTYRFYSAVRQPDAVPQP
ncbi:MAG: diguanylate cyclase [Betaproteobacteria bacterium]